MKHRGTALGVILAFLCFLTSLGCQHKSSNTAAETKAPAPLGTPGGPATSGTIGPGGGVLRSADGRVSIEVPPGTVPSNTPFAIQPFNNTEPNGIGPIYVLSPEGLRFAQPVTLAWHLSDSDLAGHSIKAVSIATRDAEGNWIPQSGVEHDPARKIVRLTAVHLSPWQAMLPDLKITPDHAQVGVRNSIALKVSRYAIQEDADLLIPPPGAAPGHQNGDQDGELLAPPNVATNAPNPPSLDQDGDLLAAPIFPDCTWKVNGRSANPASGQLSVTSKYTATYTAPAKIPPTNPVAVSCEDVKRIKGRKAKIIAVAYITVTDQPKPVQVSLQYSYIRTDDYGEERQSANGNFSLEPSEAVFSGQGVAHAEIQITGKSANPICTVGSLSKGRGDVQVLATGSLNGGTINVNFAGRLQVEDGEQVSEGMKCSWRTQTREAYFQYGCQFHNVDITRSDTYTTTSDDGGQRTCTIRVSPQ